MKEGDKVRITPQAWGRFITENGSPAGQSFNPGLQTIQEIKVPGGPYFMLSFPHHWWEEEELILASEPAPPPMLDSRDVDALTRAFCALMEMWGRRYDYPTEVIDTLVPEEGDEFPGPVVVDLGPLAVAHSELMSVIRKVNPDLHASLIEGGTPDAPLPIPDLRVTNLDDVRIRAGKEFEDEQVAYVEALWGKTTYAFNAAVRDLEGMRRGTDDGTLRRPETYYEGQLLVGHVRALANDLARNFGMDHMVREGDDLEKKP